MQVELIEQIIHLPIADRVEIIERISRSVREDLQKSSKNNLINSQEKELSIEEKMAIVKSLAGSLKMENPPMTREEERQIYYEHISEKYK